MNIEKLASDLYLTKEAGIFGKALWGAAKMTGSALKSIGTKAVQSPGKALMAGLAGNEVFNGTKKALKDTTTVAQNIPLQNSVFKPISGGV